MHGGRVSISGSGLRKLTGITHRFPGRVTEFLETKLGPGTYCFYLCGRREMIGDTMEIIDDKFPEAKVFTEQFT